MYKNSLLLTALLACNITTTAQENDFTPQQFTLTYTITPTEMTEDAMVMFDQMSKLIDDAHNDKPTFYQDLFTFIHDIQTVIHSGMNLVGHATTTSSQLLTTIEEAIESTQKTESTNDENNITQHPNELMFQYTIFVDKPEDYQLWTTIKELLINLQQMLQDQTSSPEAAAQLVATIMQEKKSLRGLMTLSESLNK